MHIYNESLTSHRPLSGGGFWKFSESRFRHKRINPEPDFVNKKTETEARKRAERVGATDGDGAMSFYSIYRGFIQINQTLSDY
jgi:hypothetical protein